ncbi:MAG: ceramidase domain-containing protein [Stappiaceae bacterium]
MDLSKQLDNYCERLSPDYWAEPINAITNLAFILAAVFVLLAWRQSDSRPRSVLFLGVWIGVIGAGSYLFHTHATVWALFSDTIPILIFILAYLFLAMRFFMHLPIWASGLITLGYIPVTYGIAPMLGPYLGSSAGYVPALLAMFIVGGLMLPRDRTVAVGLLSTASLFLISLCFRMADEPLCDNFPLGTHFMWHILNAVVLYRLAMIYLKRREQISQK